MSLWSCGEAVWFFVNLFTERHKYGIKTYVLTDLLGFILKCIIYSGSNDTEVRGKGHVTNVVKKLLEGKLGVSHSIYMDNYYNSVELAQ